MLSALLCVPEQLRNAYAIFGVPVVHEATTIIVTALATWIEIFANPQCVVGVPLYSWAVYSTLHFRSSI